MRIIYRHNLDMSNRWRIDFHPNERIENIGYVSKRLHATAPDNPDFVEIRKIIEQYCSDLNIKAQWCI